MKNETRNGEMGDKTRDGEMGDETRREMGDEGTGDERQRDGR